MNNTYFTVHVVSMVGSGEWDGVDICLEPPNDHDFEDSGDEDFGGILYITLIVCFSGRS